MTTFTLTGLRLALLQIALCLLGLALSAHLLPVEMRDALHALPTVALRAIKLFQQQGGTVGAAGAVATLVAARDAFFGDELFLPWLGLVFTLATLLNAGLVLLVAGWRPIAPYAGGLVLSLALPGVAGWISGFGRYPTLLGVGGSFLGEIFAWRLVLGEVAGVLHDTHKNATWLDTLKRPYDVRKYLHRSVFVGLVPTRKQAGRTSRLKPLWLDAQTFHKNHAGFIGASGSGKTKLAALALVQLHEGGDAVVVFDPKNDEFLPGILRSAAQRTQTPFIYLDLRLETAQVNPLQASSPEEMSLLLQAGLGLDPTGDPGVDYYRGADREACDFLCERGPRGMTDLIRLGGSMKMVTQATHFWRTLQALARVKAFHTQEGPDLGAVLAAGGVIYIAGSTTDLRVVAAQRMLLALVCQIITARPRDGARQVALMLDEFKYMLSNSALRALGTIRDRRCNLLLAFQSFKDLADCGSLNPVAVRGAADNCTLNFIYKLSDRSTAEDFVKMAGDDRVMVESVNKDRVEGQWREANRQAVSIDMLTTNAPKAVGLESSVAWVFGRGPAFPLSTSHLPGGDAPQVVRAAPVEPVTPGALLAAPRMPLKPAQDLDDAAQATLLIGPRSLKSPPRASPRTSPWGRATAMQESESAFGEDDEFEPEWALSGTGGERGEAPPHPGDQV